MRALLVLFMVDQMRGGIRKRVKEASGHEYYASLRTHAALEKAEVAVVLIDAFAGAIDVETWQVLPSLAL